MKSSLKPTNSTKDSKMIKPTYRNSVIASPSIEPLQKVNRCNSSEFLCGEYNGSQIVNNSQNASNHCPEQYDGIQNPTDRKNETDNKHKLNLKANKASKKECETQTKPEMTQKEHKPSVAKGRIKICDSKSKVSH